MSDWEDYYPLGWAKGKEQTSKPKTGHYITFRHVKVPVCFLHCSLGKRPIRKSAPLLSLNAEWWEKAEQRKKQEVGCLEFEFSCRLSFTQLGERQRTNKQAKDGALHHPPSRQRSGLLLALLTGKATNQESAPLLSLNAECWEKEEKRRSKKLGVRTSWAKGREQTSKPKSGHYITIRHVNVPVCCLHCSLGKQPIRESAPLLSLNAECGEKEEKRKKQEVGCQEFEFSCIS
ncbi:hypothetical protein CDAR_546221 [Caerostris darwini]|uniref:Uncharacterized protein n=1 Tax=Caerostris darwini TaxID=1538125 RepID=A0AAV4VEC3_9ARAC|nr:hypothetical protein CDAR_546221 [Caerostris darwini]